MDPTDLIIPDKMKERIADGLVSFLARQAERLGQRGVANQLRQITSQGDFYQAIQQALEVGYQRFKLEYALEDEDLVEAILNDDQFWHSEAVQNALVEMISRPGAWLDPEREMIVQGFSTVLPERINRQRVDKAINFLLRCMVEELWTLPGAKEIRDVYSLQFQRLTAESVREQTAIARQQLEMTTQLSQGVQQALLQLTGALEQNLLAAPASNIALPDPKPYHNLPQPPYVHFVGRENELGWLRERLLPTDRAWQIALTGIGGVGKSAIALAIAYEYRDRYHELLPEERFEAIIWVSAKEEVLTAYGREQADLTEKILHTLEDVYTAIAQTLEREDITRAQPEEQGALVEKALRRQRTLLIMDNLESVQDGRIRPFLRRLPSPTKALITSREWLDVADVLPLTGLSWEEADALIQQDAELRQVGLDAGQRRQIFELTSGLPLPIKLGVARLAGGESFTAVARWLGDAEGELPEYCVKGQIELAQKRDHNAWKMLLACSLFDRTAGASRSALGEIADLSLTERDKGLAHLLRLYLINQIEDRFWVFPIVQRYVRIQSVSDDSLQILTERWRNWLLSFTKSHDLHEDLNESNLKGFELEYPNVKLGIQWCNDLGFWEYARQLCRSTWGYVYFVSLFSDLEEILLIWENSAQKLNNESDIAIIFLQFGRLYWIWEQPNRALNFLVNSKPLLEEYEDFLNLAEAEVTKADILSQHRFEHDAALEIVDAVYKMGERLKNDEICVLAGLRFASIAIYKQNFSEAEEWLDYVEKHIGSRKSQRETSSLVYRRARLLQELGDYSNAETFFNECLNISIHMQDRRSKGSAHYRLAQIYFKTSRYCAAEKAAQLAYEEFDRIGKSTEKIQDLLDEIHEQIL